MEYKNNTTITWIAVDWFVYLQGKIKVMTDILHHLARLEMMMAEERGINLSYIEALEIAKLK